MAELSGVEVLQSEIEKAKDKLRNYNENIKKLTGRDPSRPGIRRILSGDGGERDEDGFNGRNARGRGRLFGMARRGIMEDNGPPSKRRVIGGAFSRLGPVPVAARRREREDSPYEEELPNKLSVQSSVVSTSREAKNRQEIMQEQTKDKEGMQRNRRMFGLLLGTLNKFKTESKTLETKEVQRKKIEEKLEENAEKEKRKFKQETKLLMEEMHLEQSKISRLQQKMEMVQEHSEREAEMEKLKNFIATKTKPRIFWMPVQSSTLVENKLKDSKKVVDDMLQEGRDRLEKEIKELMEREYKREERIKMRLREDGLLGDEEEVAGDENNRNKTPGEAVGDPREESVKLEEENTGLGLSSRLGRHVELKNTEVEHDDEAREWDSKKKTRRTVVVEKEGSESDSDESLEIGKGEGGNSKVESSKTSGAQKRKHSKDVIGSNQSSDEEREGINIKQERGQDAVRVAERGQDVVRVAERGQDVVRVGEREIRRKGHRESQDRHVDKERNKVSDEDGVEDARERLRDKRHEEKRDKRREVSEEKDRRRHRRGEEKLRHDSSEKVGSTRDKERSHREGREERKEKEKRGGHDSERRHVSQRSKDKRKDSESSAESEVEIKREKKDDRDTKGKKVKDYYRHSDRKSGDREGGFDKESEGKNKNKIPDNADVHLDSDNEATE
ncbi:unnamed protein product [Lymnaea stagnalis]|uniref:Pinin n=1 Tax=Lymnaea stagnalis TaxID=6523 RepID=A0AAV2HQM7_LYMST